MLRPGFRTSEFIVALLTVLGNLVNASQAWVSWRDAVTASVAAAAYIISRGLAKYEPRGTGGNPAP